MIAGGLVAVAGLYAGLYLLCLGRRWWFEAPNGDDLQYFDLMIYLGLAGFVLTPPAAIVGGAVGGRWVGKARRTALWPHPHK